MDKYEKKILFITGGVIMLFLFSLLYAKVNRRIDLPECTPYSKIYNEPKVVKLDKNLYQVFVVAQMWQFQPEEIHIQTGSTVDFYLTSKDVVHGFNIFEKNVNLMAVYGGINKMTVRFDEPGVYHIVCHEYCGIGHHNMEASVVVNSTGTK
jgi:cytochrome c oxidase subunit II